MNIYTYLNLAALVLAVSLGLYVYFNSKRSRLSFLYLLIALGFGFLNLSQFQMRISSQVQEAWLWSKAFSVWPLLTVLSLHFVLELNRKKLNAHLYYPLLYVPGFLFSYIQFSSNWIALAPVEKYWGWSIVYQPTKWYYAAEFFGMLYWTTTVFLVFYYYKKFKANAKKQVLYIAIGFALNYIFTLVTDLPLFYTQHAIPELGAAISVLPLFLVAYGILYFDSFSFERNSVTDQLFRNISNGLLYINHRKLILEINDILLEKLQYKREEIVGRPFNFLLPKETKGVLKLDNYQILSTEFKYKKIFFRAKDGSAIPLVFSSFIVGSGRKGNKDFIFIGQDEDSAAKHQYSVEKNNKEVKFLAESALELVNLETKEEVYAYASKKIYHLLDEKAVVGCTELVEKSGKNEWKLTSINGLKNKYKELFHLLGFDIETLSASNNQTFTNQLVAGKLNKLDFNLGDLTGGYISNATGEKAKALLGLKALYTLPIQFGNNFYGALHIAKTKNTPELNQDLLETFMNLVSMILSQRFAEWELAQNEQLFRSVIENSSFIISVVDKDGKFLVSDGKGLEKLNIKPKEILGLSVFRIYKNRPDILEMIHRALAGETFKELVHLKGNTDWNTSFAPLYDEKGAIIGTLAMSDDISSRIAAENKLTDLNEMQNKLFSIIGHDLKSPTATILSYSNLILEDFETFSASELKHLIGNIQNTAQTAYQILSNLLEWAKSIQSFTPLNQIKISLKSESQKAINQVQVNAQKKKITIQNKIEDKHSIYADPYMFTTTIRNLLSNAIKFTEQNGHIGVHSIEDKTKIQLFISDTGIGMSQEQIKKLFQFEAHKVSRGTEGEIGSGFGLQICKDFVEKNGGSIEVQSQLKEGSVITLNFPKYKKAKKKAPQKDFGTLKKHSFDKAQSKNN
jgi:PAS domain S-box-containing protein